MAAPRNGDSPKIAMNLDTIQREDAPTDFTFVLDAKTWKAIDPKEVDWQILDALNPNDGRAVMRVFLGDEFAKFEKIKLPAWKLDNLAQSLVRHFGLRDNLGEADGS